MEPFVRIFIRSSLVWLGVGVLIGVWMSIDPAAVVYRPAHMHANLLGFVSMMIFGVAYHVVPRFTGNALCSRRTAMLHVWVANVGLLLVVIGWMLRLVAPATSRTAVIAGGATSAIGTFLFIGNIWLTLEPRRAPGPVAMAPSPAGVRRMST